MASAAPTNTIPVSAPPAVVAKPSGVAAKGKQREKPLASLLAGATAGAIEGFVTYPTEYAKTQLQFGAKNAASANGVAVRVSS
jgi:hypothetical protein